MNPTNGNTLKDGLIAATTTVTIDILNSTFPRVERRNEMVRGRRQLAYLDSSKRTQSLSSQKLQMQHRTLVYYTDEVPVTIDRIIDIENPCDPGQNCLLVVSTITVMLEEGDDPAEVYDAINDGMKSSFGDSSFFAAIPEDTVICP